MPRTTLEGLSERYRAMFEGVVAELERAADQGEALTGASAARNLDYTTADLANMIHRVRKLGLADMVIRYERAIDHARTGTPLRGARVVTGTQPTAVSTAVVAVPVICPMPTPILKPVTRPRRPSSPTELYDEVQVKALEDSCSEVEACNKLGIPLELYEDAKRRHGAEGRGRADLPVAWATTHDHSTNRMADAVALGISRAMDQMQVSPTPPRPKEAALLTNLVQVLEPVDPASRRRILAALTAFYP